MSAGTTCQLPLSYAPTAIGSGTLTFGYSYTNDAGFAKTGTVSIAYRAKPIVRQKATYAIDHCGLDAVLNLFA